MVYILIFNDKGSTLNRCSESHTKTAADSKYILFTFQIVRVLIVTLFKSLEDIIARFVNRFLIHLGISDGVERREYA